MRKTTKAKVARMLTSSLMSSDLTTKELMEVCESLMGRDDFVHEFGYNLQNLIGSTMYLESKEDEDIEYVYVMLRRRRITKNNLQIIIDDMFPGLGDYLRSQRLSLKLMIEVVRDNSGDDGWSEFVDRIRNDDYLEHIMGKAN